MQIAARELPAAAAGVATTPTSPLASSATVYSSARMLRSTLQDCCRLLIHPLERVLESAHGSGTLTQIPLKVSVSVRAWARRPRRRTSVSLHDPSHSIKRRVAVMGKHAHACRFSKVEPSTAHRTM